MARLRLKSDLVEETFLACLFDDGEPILPRIEALGIMSTAGFHPDRIEAHYGVIAEMLECLPVEFQQSGGGGMSFLNACMDKDGGQWTGFHLVQEHLFQLGIAAGRVKCLLPRATWSALPGGVPYYMVTTERQPVQITTEDK